MTSHLSLSHEAREESVVQIWRYIKGLRGPVILTGDFNAEPQEKALRLVLTLREYMQISGPDYNFSKLYLSFCLNFIIYKKPNIQDTR